MPNENLPAMLAEMDAQGAADRAVSGVGSPSEAILAVRGALSLAGPPETLGEEVGRLAMRFIAGESVTPVTGRVTNPDSDFTRHLFETIALMWQGLHLGRGLDADAVRRLYCTVTAREAQWSQGAVERMALLFWLDALYQLGNGEREEARRLWQRALSVGSAFGTESHPVVLWTYLASYFPERTKAPGRPRSPRTAHLT